MNWLLNIFDSIKWRIEDAVWIIKDKVEMWKLDREIEKEEYAIDTNTENFEVEEIEIKPKKKKAKKKSAKKAKKSV